MGFSSSNLRHFNIMYPYSNYIHILTVDAEILVNKLFLKVLIRAHLKIVWSLHMHVCMLNLKNTLPFSVTRLKKIKFT